jgi:hypothetical protein
MQTTSFVVKRVLSLDLVKQRALFIAKMIAIAYVCAYVPGRSFLSPRLCLHVGARCHAAGPIPDACRFATS